MGCRKKDVTRWKVETESAARCWKDGQDASAQKDGQDVQRQKSGRTENLAYRWHRRERGLADPYANLPDLEHLVRLHRQPPARMREAVGEGGGTVLDRVRTVHGLEQKVAELEPFETFRHR